MPVCSKCGFEKHESDFYFQNKYKGKLQKRCKECAKASSKEWAERNKDKVKKWREDNRARTKAWRIANSDKLKAYARKAYDKKLEKQGKTRKKGENYPNANAVISRNKHLESTFYGLSDAAKTSCEVIYEIRKNLDKETGVKHHVDHIVPICGVNVSGLHVPWNLRVVPSSINYKKNVKTFGEEFWDNRDVSDFIIELYNRNGFPHDTPTHKWRWPLGR